MKLASEYFPTRSFPSKLKFSRKAETIGDAMLMVYRAYQQVNLNYKEMLEVDIWKDLTRAFSGRELNQEIIKRCEGWGVDCSRIKRKR